MATAPMSTLDRPESKIAGPTLWKTIAAGVLLAPAWFFLWLLIPPPLNLDQRLVTRLQTFTARQSSRLLDQLGVLHVMQGNVVVIPHKHLLVEEACSGINSLFSMLACTLFFVLW